MSAEIRRAPLVTDAPEDWVREGDAWRHRRHPELLSNDGGKTYSAPDTFRGGMRVVHRSVVSERQVEVLRLRSAGVGAPGDVGPRPIRWVVADEPDVESLGER